MNFMKSVFPKKKHKFTSAVIVAAGSSSRMNCCDNKQLLEFNGVPVFVLSALAFEKANTIDEIILVVSDSMLNFALDKLKEFGITKPIKVVQGGDSRSKSVSNGLNAVNEKAEFIAIHDGARPFVLPNTIDLVSVCAYEYGAAAPGIKVTSTVKKVNSKSVITDTVDRDTLRLIQTPQTFELKKYKKLFFKAMAKGNEYTDDCQLFEKNRLNVMYVPGEETNIKLTTDNDLIFAKAICEMYKGEDE